MQTPPLHGTHKSQSIEVTRKMQKNKKIPNIQRKDHKNAKKWKKCLMFKEVTIKMQKMQKNA